MSYGSILRPKLRIPGIPVSEQMRVQLTGGTYFDRPLARVVRPGMSGHDVDDLISIFPDHWEYDE